MMQEHIKDKQTKYDSHHDILHIFLKPSRLIYDDEVYPGVIIRRSEIDDDVVGLRIIDFSKRSPQELTKMFPQYNLSEFSRKHRPYSRL